MRSRVSIREFQAYIYLVFLALGIVLLFITSNDLIFYNTSIYDSGLTFKVAGDWEYWIFALGIVLVMLFAYMYTKITRDYRKFRTILDGNSKQTFVKNLKNLQKIARNLGPRYEEELRRKIEEWKVK
ncbi:MAG: DUF3198 domain-containing protein [Thermoplasmataceae archaeon]